MNCRVCHNKLEPFFSLGEVPLVNSFLKKGEIAREKKFDLTVAFCSRCYLVQLLKTVPPEDMFRNYVYFSSTSSSFLKHCEEIANKFTRRFKLGNNSLVLEIASNDGALLGYFKKLGVRILGIDPAKNIAKVANANGIRTIPDFFNYRFAKKIVAQNNIKADLVFGANVLAHVPGIVDFAKGVKLVLAPQGTAIFEFPYLKGLMDGKFDTIYHEHVFYYGLMALRNLFNTAGLEIYDVEKTAMQGGSLSIYISHPGVFKIKNSVKNLMAKEKQQKFNRIETYRKIQDRSSNLKADLIGTLDSLKKSGKTVAAYSAPAKGNVLLNYFGIKNHLDFIVDKSKAKQGLYTPGTHLLVHPTSKIYQAKPDYLMILCWNIAGEVMEEFDQYRKNGGKFIIPVPKLKIL